MITQPASFYPYYIKKKYFCTSKPATYKLQNMKRFLTLSLLVLMCFSVAAQTTISFKGQDDNSQPIQLDRVVVTNHSKGWQQTLYWPQTSLTLKNGTDIDAVATLGHAALQLSQNNPNPFNGSTYVNLTLADAGELALEITDMNGYKVAATNYLSLHAGIHQFRLNLANAGTYILTARQNKTATSIKMVCNEGRGSDIIEYQGIAGVNSYVPQSGDQMEYVGYASINGIEVESQHITQTQVVEQTFTLQFATRHLVAPSEENSIISSSKGKAGNAKTADDSEGFRVALSLSPFSLNQFEQGYSFVIGDSVATTPEQLQSIYRSLGSTEMYVRIATKRHKTAEDVTDGEPDENANVHTFDQGLHLCRIAASLNIPINPEIMCAYTYMDMDRVQPPRFEEYPEIYALQNGKAWSELSLDEVCTVLEAYGEFVADSILATGCTVNNWNLGNEANFGFAGIGMGVETAIDSKLGRASAMKRYMASMFSTWWLKKHVWNYNVEEFKAVKAGILKAYAKAGIDASKVKFSTHIATVVFTPRTSASYFQFMNSHGYTMETAGISYYPSAPAMSFNKKKLLIKTITKINKKCGTPVFIGEFSYPSGKMDGPFAGWNKKLKGYEKDQQGQSNIYRDVMNWGKGHGMAGIRYWAPDYEGWYAMSMFEFSNKRGTAKVILQNHKEIVGN